MAVKKPAKKAVKTPAKKIGVAGKVAKAVGKVARAVKKAVSTPAKKAPAKPVSKVPAKPLAKASAKTSTAKKAVEAARGKPKPSKAKPAPAKSAPPKAAAVKQAAKPTPAAKPTLAAKPAPPASKPSPVIKPASTPSKPATNTKPAAAIKPTQAAPVARPAEARPPNRAGYVKPERPREEIRRPVQAVERVSLPVGYKPQPNEEYMNAYQLEYFRQKLLGWHRDLVDESQQTIENLKEEVRDVGDEAERATRETENALELRTRDRYRKLINKIDSTLRRLDEGDYGFCVETGEPIGLDRLEARPTAERTLDAQERWEHQQKQLGD